MRCLFTLLAGAALALAQQAPLLDDHHAGSAPVRVAIVGGGIAGAAVASRLATFRSVDKLNITVFERESEFGGRIQSVIPDAEWGSYPLELGAGRTTAEDSCIFDIRGQSISQRYDLSPADIESTESKPTYRTYCSIDDNDWREWLRLVLKYGRSAIRVKAWVTSIKAGLKNFLDADDADGNLNDAMARAGLTSDLFTSANTWLTDRLGESSRIEQELIQPCTQTRMHKDDYESNALSSLQSAGWYYGSYYSYYGYQNIVESAFQYARIEQHLNAYVFKVKPGENLRYSVSWMENDKERSSEFDVVVLATPFSLAAIDLDSSIYGLATSQLPLVEYDERHVTYFTSPLSLKDEVKDKLDVLVGPDTSYTSLTPQFNITSLMESAICYPSCRPGDPICGGYNCEYLYKIVSRHGGQDADLTDLLNHNSRGRKDYHGKIPLGGVTWSLRKAWKAGLPELQSTTPDSVEVAPGLFYTSGLDHVMSSMEMNCRMGRYVADKILKEW